jgi:hypothetical protein
MPGTFNGKSYSLFAPALHNTSEYLIKILKQDAI